MRWKTAFLAFVAAVALAAVATSATGAQKLDPGVTAKTIVIGGTFPFSGPAALYSAIPLAERAYFLYVDAHGGVNGRKIQFRYYDDAYDPSKTPALTQRLVEQDHVFAVYGSLGTAPVLATRAYLNGKKVPQVLVATGDSYWGEQYKQYPWTIGWQPDYPGEAKLYANFINTKVKQAKIGVLYQNDAYGQQYLSAFKAALSNQSQIVSAQSYDVTGGPPQQQVIALKAAGANTFVLFSTPTATIQGLVIATKIGWHPIEFINNVSANELFMGLAAKSGASVDGAISTGYVDDANAPSLANTAGVSLAKKIVSAYDPKGSVYDVNVMYGLASAWTMTEALKNAGSPPTRAGLIKALLSLHGLKNPFLYPGFKENTSATDHFPVDQLVLTRYHSTGGAANQGYFEPFGKIFSNLR
ncbi:MAG TPA: ABC transporter substrate-binding protein [Gaiellaceae bacterium]|nr:ABC transporter substrate-binding protein [Gaiellaceae bacterium]